MFDELILEEKCSECEGSGMSYGSRCPHCGGKRFIPTERGEAVLSFVRRQLS